MLAVPDPTPITDSEAAGSALSVDDEGIVLPGAVDPETTYDILLNGQHVWSLQPGRDAIAGTEAGPRAEWPRALRRYLSGRAEVILREHVGGVVLASAQHSFEGVDDSQVLVVDQHGRELLLDKWGRLIRPLSSEDSGTVHELMSEVVRLLEVLRDECGVPAYICYGTLLGAVRNGRLIGYDNDIDVAYVSEHENPVDVIREGFRIQRILTEQGQVARRGSGSRLNVRLKMQDGSMRFVDVFTSHWVDGVLLLPNDVGAPLPREAMLPLSTIELMGWQVAAPARPEALLAATYGENWRTPDPSFKYETARWLSRRLGGWYGGMMMNRKHWDIFNATAPKRVSWQPTPFAEWVAKSYPSTRPIFEIGSGTGRDALWFAQHGRQVLGIDYSTDTVGRARRRAARDDLPVEFKAVSLYDTRATLALGAQMARGEAPVDVYARFILHALTDPGRLNFWRLASMSLRRGGNLFLEFRTTKDEDLPHFFGQHFRRFLEPDEIVKDIAAAGGKIVHREEGHGLAPFGEEDPHVCRIVAQW
jgi:SAM-dependent methyltransferase